MWIAMPIFMCVIILRGVQYEKPHCIIRRGWTPSIIYGYTTFRTTPTMFWNQGGISLAPPPAAT